MTPEVPPQEAVCRSTGDQERGGSYVPLNSGSQNGGGVKGRIKEGKRRGLGRTNDEID